MLFPILVLRKNTTIFLWSERLVSTVGFSHTSPAHELTALGKNATELEHFTTSEINASLGIAHMPHDRKSRTLSLCLAYGDRIEDVDTIRPLLQATAYEEFSCLAVFGVEHMYPKFCQV